MSLNSREEILHWHLRDRVVLLTITVLALGGMAMFGFFVAVVWPAGRDTLEPLSSLLLFIDAFITWRLRRTWKHLEALEQFIK